MRWLSKLLAPGKAAPAKAKGSGCLVCGGRIKPQPSVLGVLGRDLRDFTGPKSEFAGSCDTCKGEVHFRCAEVEFKDFGPDASYSLVKCPRCGETIQRID